MDLADFADATWIATKPAAGFQALTESACRGAGFNPRIDYRADSYDLLLSLVGADLGVTLVPELLAAARPGLTCLPVARPAGPSRDVHLTTRARDPFPTVTVLARCFRAGPAGVLPEDGGVSPSARPL